MILGHTKIIDTYDPYLTVDGVRLVAIWGNRAEKIDRDSDEVCPSPLNIHLAKKSKAAKLPSFVLRLAMKESQRSAVSGEWFVKSGKDATTRFLPETTNGTMPKRDLGTFQSA